MAKRISATEAHEHVQSGNALLVCAYDSDEKFRQMPLEGAIPLSELQSQEGDLSKDKELIFY